MVSLFGQNLNVTGSTFSNVGGAVSDLFSAFGAGAANKSYGQAVQGEVANIGLTKSSTALQEAMASRKIEMGLGAEEADVAGAGFSSGGSAGDLLRSSVEQGALTKGLIGIQGQVQENSFKMQQDAYQAEADASKMSGIGAIFGSALKGAGAIAGLFF